MCGRYSLFVDEDIEELRAIVQEAEQRSRGAEMKTGEIFPTNPAPVLVRNGQKSAAEILNWGFPGFSGKGVIINARAETAEEKKMFRTSLMDRRCVIPSTGFYEWKHEETKTKQKYKFNLPGEPLLYMAGFWNEFEGERRFVILTTEPNESIADVHNRMPVVLTKDSIDQWISDLGKAMELLHAIPLLLVRDAV